MKALALLPLIINIIVLMTKGEKVAFKVVLFCLFAIPSYYYFPTPGLPDFNFFHFSLFPLFGWWIMNRADKFKVEFLDVLVFLYAFISVVSEFSTMGFADGRNLLIDRTVQIIMPYILAKEFLATLEDKIEFAKFVTLIGAVLAFFSPLEFKFDLAVVDVLQFVWPEYLRWPGWARYGYVRAAAVYAHPILAGMMWAFYSLFAIWLRRRKVWKNDNIAKLIILLNLAGMFMAISKGPILGFIAGGVLLVIGWTKKRLMAFTLVAIILAVGLPPASIKFMQYASVNRFNAQNETQENIAYRKELVDNYIVEVEKQPLLGYGRNGMPVVNGQVSIDNQYLFIALLHGVIAMYLFLGMTFYSMFKCLKIGLNTSFDNPSGELAWLIVACAFTWFVTLGTVWMGAQSEQIIFVFIAFASTMKIESFVKESEKETISSEWSFRQV